MTHRTDAERAPGGPTGVFVRLPLDEAQILKLYNPQKSGNENLIAIGTPVTGAGVEVAAYDNIASGHLSRVEPVSPNISLVRRSDALAKLAEKDAEIARMAAEIAWIRGRLEAVRSCLTEAPAFVSNCGALEVTEEALKGPEA